MRITLTFLLSVMFTLCFGSKPSKILHNAKIQNNPVADICNEITTILDPVTDGGIECFSANNSDNNSEIGDCDQNGASTWVAFTTDGNASAGILQIDGSFNGIMSLYIGTDCDSLQAVFTCNENLVTVALQTNSTYFVKIEAGNGENLGDFVFCVNVFFAAFDCYPDSEITSVMRPENPNANPYGPYCPGETVNFCIKINFIVASAPAPEGNSCQWIQGVIPSLGNAWDYAGSNLNIQGPGGNWFWLPQDNVDYNHNSSLYSLGTYPDGTKYLIYGGSGAGMPAGTLLPGGWWVTSPGSGISPGVCSNDGDPDNMWGDPFSCNGNQIYDFCISLKVKEKEQLQDCNDKDLGITMTVFADGETGCWSQISCALSTPIVFDGEVDCVSNVIVSGEDQELCSKGSVDIEVFASEPGATITVNTIDNPNVIGESFTTSSGIFQNSSAAFTETLINTGTSIEVVQYVFSANSENSTCQGSEFIYEVTVYPDIEIFIDPIFIPKDSCGDITPLVTGGTGNFVDYQWSTEEHSQIINVCPLEDTDYMLTVTDDFGCSSSATTSVTVTGTRFYIQGLCFTDANFNSIYDPNQDYSLHNVAIEILNNNSIYFSNNDGYFNMEVDSGMNQIDFVIHFGDWLNDTISRNVNVINPQNYLFIGFKPEVNNTKSCITALTTTIQQCNLFSELNPQVFNTASTPLNGYMKVYYDPQTYFSEMTPLPSGGQDNYFIWAFNDLKPSQTFAPKIKYWVPDTSVPDDSLHFTVQILDNITNDTLSSFSISEKINCNTTTDLNSNHSWPDREGEDNPTLRGEAITYKVNFTNDAELRSSKLEIINSIDNNLELSSLKIQKSSHPFDVLYQDRNLVFYADSLSLGNKLEPESNAGFITFTLEQKPDLPDGTVIYHNAFIDFKNSFSYNTPDIKNTIVSEIYCAGLDAVALQTDNSLSVSLEATTYEWVDCSTGNVLSTSAVFNPNENGLYKCVLHQDNCFGETPCFNFIKVSTENINTENIYFVPNPSSSKIEIKTEASINVFTKIYDVNAKEILTSNQRMIDIENLESGIYIIEIQTERSKVVKRLIKI